MHRLTPLARSGRPLRRAAWIFAAIALAPSLCAAQSQFDPPPPTSPDAIPSSVRGIANPQSQPPIPSGPIGAEAAPAATFTPPSQPGGRYSLVGEDNPRLPGVPGDEVAAVTPTPHGAALPIEGAEIIARVEGEVILASDVLWQVRQLFESGKIQIPPEHRAEAERVLTRQLMMMMVDTKVLYADFRRRVPAENMPKIEETLAKPFEESEIPRLIGMLGLANRTELEDLLAESGTSLKDVQRQFNEKQIAQQWLKEKLPKVDPVSYDALLAYYQDHLTEYEYGAKVKWEELLVRFDRCGGDRDAAWRQLCDMGNAVWQTAQANPSLRGPAFTAVARAKSHGVTADDGGQYDWTTLGVMKCEAINEALTSLAIGQMSSGIESEAGFHIVRVLERMPAGRRPFTEVQTTIRDFLEGEQRVALVDAELKSLRSASRAWTIFDGDLTGPRLCELLEQQSKRR